MIIHENHKQIMKIIIRGSFNKIHVAMLVRHTLVNELIFENKKDIDFFLFLCLLLLFTCFDLVIYSLDDVAPTSIVGLWNMSVASLEVQLII